MNKNIEYPPVFPQLSGQEQFRQLILRTLSEGTDGVYRNGIRRSVYGASLSFDLSKRFPLFQIKEVKYNDAFVDLLWMLTGSDDVSLLDKLGMKFNFWKAWAIKGKIGNVYGRAWRHAPNNGRSKHSTELLESGHLCPSDRTFDVDWIVNCHREVDQIADVVHGLKTNPNSSRHRISTYIPGWAASEHVSPETNYERGKGVMTPCASFLQFTVDGNSRLNLHVLQASSDLLIGLPVNVAQYAAFTVMMARECGLELGTLHYVLNDAHLYGNQIDTLKESGMLEREFVEDSCKLELEEGHSIFTTPISALKITGYEPEPFIKFEVSV